MLPTFLSLTNGSEPSLDFNPDQAFLNNTSLLDLVAAISPEAGEFVSTNLAELATAIAEFNITAGVLTGFLETDTGETISTDVDVPAFLTDLATTLGTAVGAFSLNNGLVNATLQWGEDLYTVENFDLATFAAAGITDVLTAVNTIVPFTNGAFLFDTDTALGAIAGFVDIADGDLDVFLETFLGDLDFSLDFGPTAQIDFTVPTPLGNIAATVNLDTGNIEIPLFGDVLEVPLSALSGNLALADGIATLTLETALGDFSTDLALADLIDDGVVDVLTGLTVDALLTEGQLDILATSPAEQFATSLDLLALNTAALETALQTNGSLAVADGLVSGLISVGSDTFVIAETAADIAAFFNASLGDLLALSPTV